VRIVPQVWSQGSCIEGRTPRRKDAKGYQGALPAAARRPACPVHTSLGRLATRQAPRGPPGLDVPAARPLLLSPLAVGSFAPVTV